jgi:hypothetical protein
MIGETLAYLISFIEKLRTAAAEAAAHDADPWRPVAKRLHGQDGDDGIERLSTQAVLDVLQIPQRNRRIGAYKRLAALMATLGWTAVRVKGMTPGGYLEQVRDFARDALNRHTPAGVWRD